MHSLWIWVFSGKEFDGRGLLGGRERLEQTVKLFGAELDIGRFCCGALSNLGFSPRGCQQKRSDLRIWQLLHVLFHKVGINRPSLLEQLREEIGLNTRIEDHLTKGFGSLPEPDQYLGAVIIRRRLRHSQECQSFGFWQCCK